ncbi:Na+/H+ antiporter NhaC [Metabacillus idriensis]|uniref:Na+/H+ antiporter NhaC n=1 Tax=Metabacillus idriensis TaxID=324768 RepID=UPI0008A949D6|nr:Na+/H+ antiporter NhaC [Metabacillus idriensis]MCM3595434.1 Na+/H+ antiporter NhaC [Metabacillus idriensis]OHR72061.1 Na+/H+ antiporter NhaC [Bacillus sp. HMSC76G11]
MNHFKTVPFGAAVMIFLSMIVIIFISLFYLKTEPHLPLMLCLVLLSGVAFIYKYSWKEIEAGLVKGIQNGVQPIIILALIGILIGAWMFSGTIPTVMIAALNLIDPGSLLILTLICCTIISSLVGSSFTTVSTVGVALMGVAIAAGVPAQWAAGAVICGACFGDKMSPMSDTTNFASGVASVNIFTHIKHMSNTTIPAFLITAFLFWYLGTTLTVNDATLENIQEIISVMEQHVQISGWTLISPLIVIALAITRIPVIPALAAGIVTAGATGILLQDGASFAQFLNVLQNGTAFEIEQETVQKMLNRGGLQSMMWSISLIMIAFALGGLMDTMQLIQTLLKGLIMRIKVKGQLILATVSSSIGVNLVTGEQYLSILIPGQSFKDAYEKMNIDKKYLSRSLEDGGTLINPLIPWGVSGAFFAQTLGVDVIAYLPFAFFLYLSPLFSVLFGFLPGRKKPAEQLAA